MKKVVIGIGIVVVLTIVFVVINQVHDKDVSSDELKFITEYERLNGIEWESNGYKGIYLSVDIPENNLIKYATDDTIVELVTNGTQVIYFGNARCNWCRSAVPVLIEASHEYNLDEIYYYDFFALRDAYEEGSNQKLVYIYETLMNEMGEFIEKTFDEDSKVAGKKRLSAPSVVIVSSGKVVDLHYKTVDSHIDYNEDLDDEEKEELKDIYLGMFKKLVYVCDDDC